MNWGNEAKDFGEAFAAASRGRWKSKSDRQREAIALEAAQLQLEKLRQEAADAPGEKAYTERMRALEEQIRILQLKAAKEGDTQGEPGADPGMSTIKPFQLNEREGGGGTPPATHVGLAGGYAHDYLEQPGEAAKSYTSPVDGTFAGKVSNEFHAVRAGGKRQHSGVDLNARNGSGVYAPIGGTVLSIGYDPGGYDHYVVFMGNDGYIQRIANHGAVRVHRGDELKAGDLLGVVARGHVHWEIIPPNSPAYRALASGGRASTQSHKGQRYPTINPADFLDLKPGTPIRAGKSFHAYDGQVEANAGPYTKNAVAVSDSDMSAMMGTDTQLGGDAGEQLDDYGVDMRGTTGDYGHGETNLPAGINNRELPGSQFKRDVNKVLYGEPDRRFGPERPAGSIPPTDTRVGAGVTTGRDMPMPPTPQGAIPTARNFGSATDVFGTTDRSGTPFDFGGGTDVLGRTGRTGDRYRLPANIIEDRESRGSAEWHGTDVLGGTDRTGARPAPPGGYGGGTNVLPGNDPGGRGPPSDGYGGGTDVFGGTDRTGGGGIPTPVSVKAVAAQGVDDFAQRTGRTGSPANRLELPDPSGARLQPSGMRPSNVGRRGGSSFSGGGGDVSLAGGTGSARTGARGLAKLGNEDRQAVLDVSTRFGIAPADLMAVIGYETIGTYNPDIVSPTGYRGLIQFGPNEQKMYGYKRGMSFADQIRGPVANYLQDRGLGPGMGLPELYSIVNAGSLTKQGLPRWGAHDSNGDLRYHVKRITDDYMPGAQVFFKSYGATDIGNATAVGYEGKPVPSPRPRGAGVGGGNGLESDTSVPTPPPRPPTPPPVVPSPAWDPLNPQRTSTAPSSLIAPSSGSPFESPVSPITPISPVSPSLAFAGGFGGSTGRTGANFNRLELPQFMARGGVVRPVRRMAAGGLVTPYSDIAIATGRTGNPQTGGEIPVTSQVTRPAAIPTPGSSTPPARPAPAADDAPDMTATDGPGLEPGDDSLVAGHKVVIDQAVKAWNGDTPPDPGDTDISGAAPTDTAAGGAGGDVIAGGGESPPGTPEPSAPDTGVPMPPAAPGDSIETGIPAPGDIKWDTLPQAQKSDPDLAKYITAAEEKVDPYHKLGESARHLAAIGRMYKLFNDRGQTEAAERAARAYVNYLYTGFNQFAAISEAAIESGNIDDAMEAGIRAWNYIPNGQTATYSKDPNGKGYLINITDEHGRVVHNHMYTPSEIAAKVLGMTPGTYWRQIVDAAGGTMPSDAFNKVKDLIDRGEPVPPELRTKLKPEEMAGMLAYETNMKAAGDAERTRGTLASQDKADKEILAKVAKDPNYVPTRAELAQAGPDVQRQFMAVAEGVEKGQAEAGQTEHERQIMAPIMEHLAANGVVSADEMTLAGTTKTGLAQINDWKRQHKEDVAAGDATVNAKLDQEQKRLALEKTKTGPVHTDTEMGQISTDIATHLATLKPELISNLFPDTMQDGADGTAGEARRKIAGLARQAAFYTDGLPGDAAVDFVHSIIQSPLRPEDVVAEEGSDKKISLVTNPADGTQVRMPAAAAAQLVALARTVRDEGRARAVTSQSQYLPGAELPPSMAKQLETVTPGYEPIPGEREAITAPGNASGLRPPLPGMEDLPVPPR